MSKYPKMPINPSVLIWARKSIGYDLKKAVKHLRVNIEKLKAWESGADQPTYSQLMRIAKTYRRISATFFLSTPPKDHKLPSDFRVLHESDIIQLDPKTIVEIREAQRKRADALHLASVLGEDVREFPHKATLNSKIDKLAKNTRELFGITFEKQKSFTSEHNAFNYWKAEVEKTGILVFQASLKSIDEMRGLAIFYSKFPLILLNTKDTPKPRTFSLLHEYCHLLLHKSGIGHIEPDVEYARSYNKVEVFCNKFAAECLLPRELLLQEDIVKKRLPISSQALKKLSNRYQVSWEVVLRRLLDIGVITQEYYESYRGQFSEDLMANNKPVKGGPPYHIRMQSYHGEPFMQLALRSYSSGKITAVDLSRYLDMKINSIEKIAPFVGGYRKDGAKKSG